MEEKQDYARDLADIRAMMERSSRFLSLSGLVGVLIGLYCLAAAVIAYVCLGFRPARAVDPGLTAGNAFGALWPVLVLGVAVIAATVVSSVVFSRKRAADRAEKVWTPTARRLVLGLAAPLVAGGILLLILMAHGITGLLAPLSQVFYGLALISAARHTYSELGYLGAGQVLLGLVGACLPAWGLALWAAGFGLGHIAYGLHMHLKYEK